MVRWEPRRRPAQALRHADDGPGDLVSVVPLGLDPVDGGPVWAAPRGTVLVPGHLAWEPLATGRHCQTWLCWSLELWVPTVVKLARPGWSRPRWTRDLERERTALRRQHHPAFPRLLADGTRDELPHLVLEHLDGPALDEALDADGPLSGGDAARLGVGLLSAVRSLHTTGTAHLDICPDNVLLVDRRVRLVDLGAARPLDRVLRRGEEVGTDDFVAPELAAAVGGPVTAAMDVYGIGATLLAVLDPTDDDLPLHDVLAAFTDPDPAARPAVDEGLALLIRHAGRGAARPWPGWADRALPRTPGGRPPRGGRRPA
jgi:serine/threonine protein kinase